MNANPVRTGIAAYGGYVPLLRMQRQSIADAHRWYDPSLAQGAVGESAMCNWDEDALTMAVEAGFDCLSMAGGLKPSRLLLASTTLPYTDRLNAALVLEALDFDASTRATDITSSQRAGTSALIAALDHAAGSSATVQTLVVASDRPPARPMSGDEVRKGDAAAALMVGTQGIVAEYLGSESDTFDFVDHYRGSQSKHDYHWEERWVRDEGYSKIVPATVARLFERASVAPAAIDALVINCPFPNFVSVLAQRLGLRREAVSPTLSKSLGSCGAATPLVGLANWLQQAQPGQTVLVVGFGQGCDALLFRTTSEVGLRRPRTGVVGYLARRRPETNYNKLLAFTGQLDFERGMRAEQDRKASLSVNYRHREFLTRFVGGRCQHCGTAQLPQPHYCIECGRADGFVPMRFSDRTGHVLSWSADFLAFSMSPPSHYGLVAFDGGGRLAMDLTDVAAGEVCTGLAVKPAFRVKHIDPRRDFRSYFWKAVPVVPPGPATALGAHRHDQECAK